MKEHRQLRKFWSFLLAFAMVFTTAVGNIGPVVMAADDDTFVEVTVPNGDFESGETAWTFTGDIQNLDYYWKLFQSAAMTNNQTTMYEVCSKKNTSVTKTYKCSQTVKGLVPGTYKASIDATGGNDPGTHTTTLTAGGKSVAVTPNKWNEWVTYTTDMFEVGEDGTCEISIDSAKEVGMSQLVTLYCILKCSCQGLLSYHTTKSRRTVFPCRYNIIIHSLLFY